MPDWGIKIAGIAPLIRSWEEGDDVKVLGHDVSHVLRTALDYVEGDDFALDEALSGIEDATSRDEFDEAMSDLYDWADKERVWIDPTG